MNDVEADLMRTRNWTELRRHYSAKIGHHWELGWLSLSKESNFSEAIKYFSESLRDPHFEEASYLVLRKLGVTKLDRPANLPLSLKLFDAFEMGELRPLVVYLCSKRENLKYAEAILKQTEEKNRQLREEELRALEKVERLSSRSKLLLSILWDKRLRRPADALRSLEAALSDPSISRIVEEFGSWIDDEPLLTKIMGGYHQRDGLALGRYLKSLSESLLQGRAATKLSVEFKSALQAAVDYDRDHVTENVLGFPYWKFSPLSPRAILIFEEKINPSPARFPEFLDWKLFFNSPNEVSKWDLRVLYEDDSLASWQLLVEIKEDALSEALLKYPSQERFLLLWAVRKGTIGEGNERRWPKDQKESDVVRANLRRAFERASNKILWFDRIRKAGCSQDLYDFVLGQIEPPILWVLEDLDSRIIENSPAVRNYVVNHLLVTAPNPSGSQELSPKEISGLLKFLTPAEKQRVLLTRFVLGPIPESLLDDENLDLMWEARARVGEEILRSWHSSILQMLAKKTRRQLQDRHWCWIRSGWTMDVSYLEKFSPTISDENAFPWADYLESAESQNAIGLILTCLRFVPDDGLKADWCRRLLDKTSDQKLLFAIQSIRILGQKSGLLAEWYQRRGEFEKSFEEYAKQMEETPVLNDYASILSKMLGLGRLVPKDSQAWTVEKLNSICQKLVPLGVVSLEQMEAMATISERAGFSDVALKWASHEWFLANDTSRVGILERLCDYGIRSNRVEDIQKLLVSHIFQSGLPDRLSTKIVHILCDRDSPYRLQHLRKEFVEKVLQIFPLHEEVLRKRAEFDYRAVVLWKAFYGTPLEIEAKAPESQAWAPRELWGLTQALTRSEDFAGLSKIITLASSAPSGMRFEPMEKEFAKIAKKLGISTPIEVRLTEEVGRKFQITIEPYGICFQPNFYSHLSEDFKRALMMGLAQLIQDRERGLFRQDVLIERFFQGMLLGDLGVKRLVQFLVKLAIDEGLALNGLIDSNPEQLLRNLPFLNHLLIFILGRDFALKAETLGLQID